MSVCMADLKAMYKEAFDAFVREEYDVSIAAYQRLLEANSGFALGYQGLAEAHSRSGQLDDAITAIRKAIELEPEEGLYHTSLSRFLQMQGKIPEAEEAAAIANRLQTG